MNRLYTNIQQYYRQQYPKLEGKVDPLWSELVLFQLGGCDFHNGPLPGVGYDIIAKEWTKNLKRYHTMLQPMTVCIQIPVQEYNGKPTIHKVSCSTIEVTKRGYLSFVKGVYQRKKKKQKTMKINELMVWSRQFMFVLLCVQYIPYIRWKYGVSVMFDPYELNGHWGYKPGKIENVPTRDVCMSVDYIKEL